MLKEIVMMAGEVDFYDSESYAGTSYKPFIGFMIFFIGLVVLIAGIVNVNTAKHQWNLFYDQRDKMHFDEPKYAAQRRRGIIMIVAGIVMMLASFILLPL